MRASRRVELGRIGVGGRDVTELHEIDEPEREHLHQELALVEVTSDF